MLFNPFSLRLEEKDLEPALKINRCRLPPLLSGDSIVICNVPRLSVNLSQPYLRLCEFTHVCSGKEIRWVASTVLVPRTDTPMYMFVSCTYISSPRSTTPIPSTKKRRDPSHYTLYVHYTVPSIPCMYGFPCLNRVESSQPCSWMDLPVPTCVYARIYVKTDRQTYLDQCLEWGLFTHESQRMFVGAQLERKKKKRKGRQIGGKSKCAFKNRLSGFRRH